MKRFGRVIIAALVPVATLIMMSSAAAAAPTAQAFTAHPTAQAGSTLTGKALPQANLARPDNPDGTPTGCPEYNLCSYLGTGSGQGAGDICFYRSGDVSNWSALDGPGGQDCHTHSGALVNTHTTGDVVLWSSKNYGGEEACIPHGSYYDDTSGNHYPNGSSLRNNINSSKQNAGGVCMH